MAAVNGVLLWYQCFKKMLYISFLLILFVNKGYGLVCFCTTENCPVVGPRNRSCVARLNGYCFSAVEEVYDPATGKLEYERSYGCLQAEETGLMQCKGHLVPHSIPQSIACCSEEDFCNKFLKPNVVAQTTPSPMYKGEMLSYSGPYHMITFVISVTVCLCILFVVVICIFIRLKQEKLKRRGYEDVEKFGSSAVHGLLDKSCDTSGSGSGITLLVQRTIGKQLDMLETIGRGRFGEVWKAKLRDECVAVKVFFTAEEASWARETDIYKTVLLRHENILGFVAADIRGTDSWTQMLLITDYLELGSLYDYLQAHRLDFVSMLRLAHSASCGLSHLHVEVLGKQGKPAIAHRDIKSRNILVKRDGTCAIADFGLAVKYKSDTNELDVATNTRVGTKRYMAPEVLDETLDTTQFEAYRMADMYSFALVLWETARRCVVNGFVEDYQLPFYEYVPSNPSFEDMKKVVCVDQIRPTIPKHWSNCETMQIMTQVMSESWKQTPGARLTALRVKKTLSRLESKHKEQKQPV